MHSAHLRSRFAGSLKHDSGRILVERGTTTATLFAMSDSPPDSNGHGDNNGDGGGGDDDDGSSSKGDGAGLNFIDHIHFGVSRPRTMDGATALAAATSASAQSADNHATHQPPSPCLVQCTGVYLSTLPPESVPLASPLPQNYFELILAHFDPEHWSLLVGVQFFPVAAVASANQSTSATHLHCLNSQTGCYSLVELSASTPTQTALAPLHHYQQQQQHQQQQHPASYPAPRVASSVPCYVSRPLREGDCVGCGVSEDGDALFFTLNGEALGCVPITHTAHESHLRATGIFHPFVSLLPTTAHQPLGLPSSHLHAPSDSTPSLCSTLQLCGCAASPPAPASLDIVCSLRLLTRPVFAYRSTVYDWELLRSSLFKARLVHPPAGSHMSELRHGSHFLNLLAGNSAVPIRKTRCGHPVLSNALQIHPTSLLLGFPLLDYDDDDDDDDHTPSPSDVAAPVPPTALPPYLFGCFLFTPWKMCRGIAYFELALSNFSTRDSSSLSSSAAASASVPRGKPSFRDRDFAVGIATMASSRAALLFALSSNGLLLSRTLDAYPTTTSPGAGANSPKPSPQSSYHSHHPNLPQLSIQVPDQQSSRKPSGTSPFVFSARRITDATFGPDDVVGCGLLLESKELFFSKNGTVFVSVPLSRVDSDTSVLFQPCAFFVSSEDVQLKPSQSPLPSPSPASSASSPSSFSLSASQLSLLSSPSSSGLPPWGAHTAREHAQLDVEFKLSPSSFLLDLSRLMSENDLDPVHHSDNLSLCSEKTLLSFPSVFPSPWPAVACSRRPLLENANRRPLLSSPKSPLLPQTARPSPSSAPAGAEDIAGRFAYFEAQILDAPRGTAHVSIGLCPPNHPVNVLPGNTRFSIAYNAVDGSVTFNNQPNALHRIEISEAMDLPSSGSSVASLFAGVSPSASLSELPDIQTLTADSSLKANVCPIISQSESFGMGVDRLHRCVFFTKNHYLNKVFFVNVPLEFLSTLHACVGFSGSRAKVRVSFGPNNLRFNLATLLTQSPHGVVFDMRHISFDPFLRELKLLKECFHRAKQEGRRLSFSYPASSVTAPAPTPQVPATEPTPPSSIKVPLSQFGYGAQAHTPPVPMPTESALLGEVSLAELDHDIMPPLRSDFAWALWGSKIIIHGGFNARSSSFMKDMWMYDLDARVWESIPFDGNNAAAIPFGRQSHSMVVLHNRFCVIFGGSFEVCGASSDCRVFDLVERKWLWLESHGAVPSPRANHSAVVFDNDMFIFGGSSWDTANPYASGMFRMSLGSTEMTWSQVSAHGKIPETVAASAVVCGVNLWVFGGAVGKPQAPSSSTHQYSFGTQEWTEVKCSGQLPDARFRHACCVVDDPALLRMWSVSTASARFTPPAPLAGTRLSKGMLIVGGRGTGSAPLDCCFLEFASLTWTRLALYSAEPGPKATALPKLLFAGDKSAQHVPASTTAPYSTASPISLVSLASLPSAVSSPLSLASASSLAAALQFPPISAGSVSLGSEFGSDASSQALSAKGTAQLAQAALNRKSHCLFVWKGTVYVWAGRAVPNNALWSMTEMLAISLQDPEQASPSCVYTLDASSRVLHRVPDTDASATQDWVARVASQQPGTAAATGPVLFPPSSLSEDGVYTMSPSSSNSMLYASSSGEFSSLGRYNDTTGFIELRGDHRGDGGGESLQFQDGNTRGSATSSSSSTMELGDGVLPRDLAATMASTLASNASTASLASSMHSPRAKAAAGTDVTASVSGDGPYASSSGTPGSSGAPPPLSHRSSAPALLQPQVGEAAKSRTHRPLTASTSGLAPRISISRDTGPPSLSESSELESASEPREQHAASLHEPRELIVLVEFSKNEKPHRFNISCASLDEFVDALSSKLQLSYRLSLKDILVYDPDFNQYVQVADFDALPTKAIISIHNSSSASSSASLSLSPSILSNDPSSPLQQGYLASSGDFSSPRGFHWTRGELIGSGAMGKVYKGINQTNGQIIAVKEVSIGDDADSVAILAELKNEVNLLCQLQHPNVVRYFDAEQTDDSIYIFMEYVPGGSIARLIRDIGRLQESLIAIYTRQILLGLEFLHQKKVIHRDIKGANILVDLNGVVKLSDFGTARKFEALTSIARFSSIGGTPYWMAPEVIRGETKAFNVELFSKVDIYSLGCTFYEMAVGFPPFSHLPYQSALFQIGTLREPVRLPKKVKFVYAPGKPKVVVALSEEDCNNGYDDDEHDEHDAHDAQRDPNEDDEEDAFEREYTSISTVVEDVELSERAADFYNLCVRLSPHERHSAQELLRHPFVNLAYGMEREMEMAREQEQEWEQGGARREAE